MDYFYVYVGLTFVTGFLIPHCFYHLMPSWGELNILALIGIMTCGAVAEASIVCGSLAAEKTAYTLPMTELRFVALFCVGALLRVLQQPKNPTPS